MSSLEEAKEIIWEDYIKVVMISPRDGSYEVVKEIYDPTGIEQRLHGAKNIWDYAQMIADEWLIHPDDTTSYLTALRRFIETRDLGKIDGRRFGMRVRYKVGGKYIWTMFNVIYPIGFNKQIGKNCLFCIRRSDSRYGDLDSVTDVPNLVAEFIKVLKINISNDTFKVVKLPSGEGNDLPESESLTDWFDMFSSEKKIHPDDMEIYTEFTNIDRMRASFAESTSPQRCKYRRSIDGEYKWVVMELVPCIEYDQDHPFVMLYVRELYFVPESKKRAHHAELNDQDHHDRVTGLKDQTSMNSDMLDIENNINISGVGVLYASLNTLSHTIGARGNAGGEDLLRNFASQLTEMFRESTCYRVGVDEFAVMISDVSMNTFSAWARDFRQKIKLETPPVASIGYAWDSRPSSMVNLVKRAEEMMHTDKELFCEKYPSLSGGAPK